MAVDRKDEERALTRDELEMADAARGPNLRGLGARELSDLISRLRDRRDRARDIGQRQRREMRGKSAPSGTSPATSDAGTRTKHYYLSAALRRAQAERKRRAGQNEEA